MLKAEQVRYIVRVFHPCSTLTLSPVMSVLMSRYHRTRDLFEHYHLILVVTQTGHVLLVR